MDSQNRSAMEKPSRLRFLFPVLGVTAFVVMVAIGERQVRSSPTWPPPSRHEVGGWEVENPAILDWAAGFNLPATVPILFAWAHSNAFAYAFDDHRLIIYLPWIFLVYFLWLFVAYRIDRAVHKRRSQSEVYIVLAGQLFLTLELLYLAMGMSGVAAAKDGLATVTCFGAWVVLTLLGWADFIVMVGNRRSAERNRHLSLS